MWYDTLIQNLKIKMVHQWELVWASSHKKSRKSFQMVMKKNVKGPFYWKRWKKLKDMRKHLLNISCLLSPFLYIHIRYKRSDAIWEIPLGSYCMERYIRTKIHTHTSAAYFVFYLFIFLFLYLCAHNSLNDYE